MILGRLLALGLGWLLISATGATAQDKAWQNCLADEPERSIAGCTDVLGRGTSESTSNRANAYRNRGIAYKDKGEYDRAIADFNEAIRLDPKLANAYSNRGETYEKKSDLSRAIADYETASGLNPRDTQVKEALARVRTALAARPVPTPSTTPNLAAVTPPAPAPNSPAAASPVRPYDPGVRVALVIGNSRYQAVGLLPNPTRDAAAIAQSFSDAGFKTVQVEGDLSREAMVKALRSFQEEADKADWAVVYYAGHGIEMNGQNYLVPVDARLRSDRDVADEAVPLERVLQAVEGTRKLRLVILDACRDNPFVGQMRRTVASRSIGRGLARVEPEGGTLVAYAAKAGQIAADGDGQNSPFVSALVKHIQTPGLEINMLFRAVRDDVLTVTGRKQEPFVYGSLPNESFFFRVQ